MVEEVDNLGDEKSDTKMLVHDHPVFKTIADGDMETMRNYFEVEGVSLELEDGTGMTPLMHASWKGQQDVAKYLLKQGADPNGGNHEHHYTSLHFAGLAGKPHICSLLLEAGAKTHHTNSVKRTAAGWMRIALHISGLISDYRDGCLRWKPRLCSNYQQLCPERRYPLLH